MARKKSYLSKANRGRAGAVLANNVLAGAQKKKARKRKEAAAAEREKERKRKEQDKLEAKRSAVAKRLELDLAKEGLYPSVEVCRNIAKEAVEASITPAKAKSYFIDGQETKIAEHCAVSLLAEHNVPYKYRELEGYESLLRAVTEFRPQDEALNDPVVSQMKEDVDARVQEVEKSESTREERKPKKKINVYTILIVGVLLAILAFS